MPLCYSNQLVDLNRASGEAAAFVARLICSSLAYLLMHNRPVLYRSMSSSERVLYWASGSPPCWHVQIALEEKGLKYESKLISLSKSATPLLEVLRIHEETARVHQMSPQCRTLTFTVQRRTRAMEFWNSISVAK